MSITLKDGAMVVLAASGLLALTATAELGLPAIALGAGLSLLSGAIAVKGHDDKALPQRRRVPEHNFKIAKQHSLGVKL